MTIVSRRSFLKLLGIASASSLVIPALTPPRDPYVREGEVVSYIGLARYPDVETFIGATIVLQVEPWDGIGYPCVLRSQCVGDREPMSQRFYDTDLACFLRELPERFWWDPVRCARYKNVHAYVREQRYGELPESVLTHWFRS